MALRRWRGIVLGLVTIGLLDALILGAILSQTFEGRPADLRFSQGPEVATLDPAKSTALADGRVLSALFEGLTVVDPATQRARPGVARRWTISPDGLVYTFELRDDARWSDGRPVTAEDFVYSWRRVLDVKTKAQYNYMLFPIKGAKDYADATARLVAVKNGDATEIADAVAESLSKLSTEALSAKGDKADAADSRTLTLSRAEWEEALAEAIRALETKALLPESRRAVIESAGKLIGSGEALKPGDVPDAVDKALEKHDVAVLTLEESRRHVVATRKAIGVRAVSPTTLEVTLNEPTSYFLELVAFVTYSPVRRDCVEKVVDGKIVENKTWVFPDQIITNGAYFLEKWVYKSRLRLTRSPHYWDRDTVRLRTVDLYPIDDPNTTLVNYERGQLDFITVVSPLAAERLIELRRQGLRNDFQIAANLGTYYYRFNVTRKPLDDVRVRKALALALDKAEMVRKAGRMGQPVTGALVPPGIPGYEPPKGLGRDVDLARRLLSEAGFPGGKGFPKLTLLYNTSESHKAMAELAQASWKRELGIDLRLANVEWKVFLDRMRNLKYDLARAGWYGDYVDPNTFLDMFVTGGGNNNTGWSNTEYDALIKQAARTLDAEKRMAVFRRAEVILVENALPILPVYHYVSPMMAKPYVKGWSTNIRNDILFQDMWIERQESVR